MRVNRRRDANVRVPDDLPDDVRRGADVQEQGHGRVPEVVEPDVPEAVGGTDRIPGAPSGSIGVPVVEVKTYASLRFPGAMSFCSPSRPAARRPDRPGASAGDPALLAFGRQGAPAALGRIHGCALVPATLAEPQGAIVPSAVQTPAAGPVSGSSPAAAAHSAVRRST